MTKELFYKLTCDFIGNKITADEWIKHVKRYHGYDTATQVLLDMASAATLREYAIATRRVLEQ